jgi:hypothetical protein
MNAREICRRLALAIGVVVIGTAVTLADTLTFQATDDAHVTMRRPDSNTGSNERLVVENRYGSPYHPEYWQIDTLVKFDLSSISAGTEISSATLSLYYYEWHDNNPAGRELTCYRVTSGWDEDTVTWNTRPTHCPVVSAACRVPYNPGAWMNWDVTSDVQMFVNDPAVTNHGWQIKDEEPWGYCNIPWTIFRSTEYGSFVPSLSVIPEPASLALLACGALALTGRR